MDERTLADLGEDDLLALIIPVLRSYQTEHAGGRLVVPPGDDAAVSRVGPQADGCAAAPVEVVATTDAMVRDRDWRDAWSSGEDVGAKVVAQNLADVAAMGGRPTGLLVTLVADPATTVEWTLALSRGIGAAAAAHEVDVLGGDLSSGPSGVLMVSVTALGEMDGRAPVLRSGALVGDVVAVCGSLGLAGAGWALLEQGRPDADPEAVARQRRPEPPLADGPSAARAGASAMLDISDGLLRDADRIGRASEVCLDLSETALTPDVERLTPAVGRDLARECVLAGGEEHSLLATFPDRDHVPAGFRVVGRVVAGRGVSLDGIRQKPRGWDHFGASPGTAQRT